MRNYCYFLLVLSFFSCRQDKPTILTNTATVSLNWHLIENGLNEKNVQRQLAEFTIKNTSTKALANNWAIYFNQNNEPIRDSLVHNGIKIKHINGDFYQISPTTSYKNIAAGESLVVQYEGNNWSIKNSDAPAGVYMTFKNKDGIEQSPILLENYTSTPFISTKQLNRNKADSFPIPTPAYRFTANQQLTALSKEEILPILPSPKKAMLQAGSVALTSQFTLCYAANLQQERNYLLKTLEAIGLNIKDYKDGTCAEQTIQLSINKSAINGDKTAAYRLTIDADKQQILIEGTDAAGVFYGIQSLRALVPINAYQEKLTSIKIPAYVIEDGPRFPYRGMHLDVARNFQSKQSVKNLLEVMANYKLNKFHFHISDDEGWRVEIPGLPELTSIGATRGHTLTEETHLQPAYGSGPTTESLNQGGTGYYSRADYLDILSYAKERHIEVIPEIDLPGHARAAIKAMEGRYKRLLKAGKTEEAKEYLLHDEADKSIYRSVQGYKDNTSCVCQESTYTFIEKVVDELIAMHQEANAPLKVIHTGGDEVPNGVWEKSPACADLLSRDKTIINTKEGLTSYFLSRFHQILNARNLVTGGWEEIALKSEQQGEHKAHVPNPTYVNKNFQAYVWNAVFGWGGEDMAYKLANAGYPVVLSNASNLYFDLAYDKDPEISGLYWAGFVDTRKAYEFVPFNLFQTASMDKMGALLDRDQLIKGKEMLTPQGQANILGIQGQLWLSLIHI